MGQVISFNRSLRQHTNKHLRSIQTFKLLIEDLLFTACKQQNTGRDAMNKEEFKVSKQDD